MVILYFHPWSFPFLMHLVQYPKPNKENTLFIVSLNIIHVNVTHKISCQHYFLTIYSEVVTSNTQESVHSLHQKNLLYI